MFTQLNPPIPLHVLDKGDGLAIGMIDYGPEHNLLWITAIDATRRNLVRAQPASADAGELEHGAGQGRRGRRLEGTAGGEECRTRPEPGEVCADCADVLAERA